MKNNTALTRLPVGLLLTLAVYAIALFVGSRWHLNSEFVVDSFSTHAVMLTLSVALIVALRKQVCYRIAMPKFKPALRAFLIGLVATLAVNATTGILTFVISGKAEMHPFFEKTSALQFLVFAFFFAPVAEEHLFRGFLQNYLRLLGDKGFMLFRRRISLPVLISALAFSLAHLSLLIKGVGVLFMIRTLLFTFVLGLIAGYYQEKHNNIVYAVLVHMAGNFLGLFAAIALGVI